MARLRDSRGSIPRQTFLSFTVDNSPLIWYNTDMQNIIDEIQVEDNVALEAWETVQELTDAERDQWFEEEIAAANAELQELVNS